MKSMLSFFFSKPVSRTSIKPIQRARQVVQPNKKVHDKITTELLIYSRRNA